MGDNSEEGRRAEDGRDEGGGGVQRNPLTRHFVGESLARERVEVESLAGGGREGEEGPLDLARDASLGGQMEEVGGGRLPEARAGVVDAVDLATSVVGRKYEVISRNGEPSTQTVVIDCRLSG